MAELTQSTPTAKPPLRKPSIVWPVVAAFVYLVPVFHRDTVEDLSQWLSEGGESWLLPGILMLAWVVISTAFDAMANESKTPARKLWAVNFGVALVGELALWWSFWITAYRSQLFGGELVTAGLTVGTTLWGLAWLRQWAHLRMDLRFRSPRLVRAMPIAVCIGLPVVAGLYYLYELGRNMGH